MSIEEKQDYLRREIVEEGLDAQQFYDFWQNFSIGHSVLMQISTKRQCRMWKP